MALQRMGSEHAGIATRTFSVVIEEERKHGRPFCVSLIREGFSIVIQAIT